MKNRVIGSPLYFAGLAGDDSGSSIWMSRISAVRLSSARAGSHGGQVRSRRIGERLDLLDFIMNLTISWPNKALEPPMALSVPLSRFTSLVGGGSAFYVRRHRAYAHRRKAQSELQAVWSRQRL
jgi:hypothetical protein